MLRYELRFQHDDTQVELFNQSVVRDVIESIADGGEMRDAIAARASLIYLDEVLRNVSILTGTLYAAQQSIVHEGHGEALIYTASVVNPVFGGNAADYVFDVVERNPFYDDSAAAITDSYLEREIEVVVVESLQRFTFI